MFICLNNGRLDKNVFAIMLMMTLQRSKVIGEN